jgi:hypothetical protein
MSVKVPCDLLEDELELSGLPELYKCFMLGSNKSISRFYIYIH